MTTVYLVVENGFVSEAYATDKNVDVVILDRDTQDEKMLESVDKEIANVRKKYTEIDVF